MRGAYSSIAQPRVAVGARRYVINMAASVAQLVVGMAIGLFFVPFLVRHVGIAAYGTIPLASALIQYLSLMAAGVNTATGREIGLRVSGGTERELEELLGVSLGLCLIAAVLMTLLSVPAIACLDWYIRIPPGLEAEARWVMAGAAISVLLGTLSIPFSVATFSLNRFDIRAAINVCQQLVYLAAVVGFFAWRGPSLKIVGAGIIAGAVFSILGNLVAHRMLLGDVWPRLSFNWKKMLALGAMSGWVNLNSIGSLLFLSVDLWVVNRYVGPTASGQYGAVLQWSQLLRALAGSVGGVLTPTILQLHAKGDARSIVHLAQRSVSWLGLAMALPVGLICGLAEPLLRVWIGPEMTSQAWLLRVLTFHLVANLAVLPLYGNQVAAGEVRLPALITCLAGLINLGLAIALAAVGLWGSIGVAVAGVFALSLKNVAFTTWHGARLLRLPWWYFLRSVVKGQLVCLAVAGCSFAISGTVSLSSWAGIVGVAALMGVAFVMLLWLCFMSDEEKSLAASLIRRFGSRRAAIGD